MFRREYTVLVIFVAILLIFPAAGFSIEKADRDAILQELSGFMDKNPEVIRTAISMMADEYGRQKKTDEAIALYEKALKILPDNEDFLNRLGDLYNQKENYAKAAEIYKKMADAKPDNVWNFQRLSDAYTRAGDKAKATAVWEDLLKKSTKAEVFMQAANFYTGINDTEKALASIKKAIELAPDNTGYMQNLESIYMRAEKFADAEALCNKILTTAKDQWIKDWANSEFINISQRQNKLPELAAKLEKDLGSSGKDISKYKNLAEVYMRTNENDKAIGVYEKAVAAGLDDKDTNGRLLDIYERANKLDKAEAQVKKIIGMAPNDNYLYERLAGILNTAGKKEDAKKVWLELLAKTPNDIGVFARYGDRLNEWGDSDGAVAQYRKAQTLDAVNLWYTMRVADIYIGKGKLDEAKKELNNIIAKTKDTWLKQQAENKIKELEGKPKEAMPVSAGTVIVPAAEKTAPAAQPPKAVTAPQTRSAPAKEAKPETKKKGFFSR
ncbi:MAG: tetratricopeptide repeat protein [Candidatus Omnitrophica bacterium]|nr:tetratricopeptide repeat protein [Candidatus Omnitrophota bacterium]